MVDPTEINGTNMTVSNHYVPVISSSTQVFAKILLVGKCTCLVVIDDDDDDNGELIGVLQFKI